MIAHTRPVLFNTASCRLVNIVSATIVAASLLVGCGGGSGGVGGFSPSTSQAVYSDSRASLPDAASRSFAPNYAPSVTSHGIWQGRTVRVYFSAEHETVVKAALQRWEDSTGGFFRWERVASAEEAQITFMGLPIGEFTPGTVGRTRYSYKVGKNELTSAEVKYAEVGIHADQTRVVVHEIGHALGVHGHSDTDPDVMYPTLTLRNVITQRDLNTMFLLYSESAAGGTEPTSRSEEQEATATVSCGEAHH